MQVAVDVAGFSPAEADELRRAMGAKRSTERMERLRGRFYAGMAANGIEGALADKIFDRMLAFANFGFPESHSISFASLVYYSAGTGCGCAARTSTSAGPGPCCSRTRTASVGRRSGWG